MKKFLVSIGSLCLISTASYANYEVYRNHCLQSGGQVEHLSLHYDTHKGTVQGKGRDFCTFHIDDGFIAVGLATFSSDKPSIAATLIKKMTSINPALLKGSFENPSMNFCKNIGGSSVVFSVMGGGFSNALGETDICVFGDGSMVSAWSLIYIADGREGYEKVRETIKAEALEVDLPLQ